MNVNMLDDSKTKFVGLENYQKVFARPDFIKSLNNTIRPVAVNQVKQELLLEAIIEEEGIDISGDAFDEYVKTTAESVDATPESILNYFGEEFIKNEYKREQATKIIMDSAIVAPKEEAAE